jgi:hypothetical protein
MIRTVVVAVLSGLLTLWLYDRYLAPGRRG